MPPKERFNLEKVLETSFDILRKSGWANVTARSIAKALKASTMPIYSAIGSMKSLERQMRKKAYEIFADYQTTRHTDNELLNIAVGQVLFAMEEPWLYRFLHIDCPVSLSSADQRELEKEVSKRLGKPIPLDSYFGHMKPGNVDAMTINVWIYTHGLAMAVMNRNLPSLSKEDIIRHLMDAGGAFLKWEEIKKTDQ